MRTRAIVQPGVQQINNPDDYSTNRDIGKQARENGNIRMEAYGGGHSFWRNNIFLAKVYSQTLACVLFGSVTTVVVIVVLFAK
jgi:hypothetical protein